MTATKHKEASKKMYQSGRTRDTKHSHCDMPGNAKRKRRWGSWNGCILTKESACLRPVRIPSISSWDARIAVLLINLQTRQVNAIMDSSPWINIENRFQMPQSILLVYLFTW